jgi:branched-chain amino acid transport system substrate-binding protein
LLAQTWRKCAALAGAGVILLAACTTSTSGQDTTSSSAAPPTDEATTSESSPTVSPGEPGTLRIAFDSELDSTGKVLEGSTAPADPANPAGDGSATCSGPAIAVIGSFTGPYGALAQNVLDGSKVAIDAHNTANSGCQVTLKEFDIAADPANAGVMAQQIADDKSIVGVVGPTFSSEMKAGGPILNTAGIATLTPSATATDLAKNGWTNFFRGVANDNIQGTALGSYLAVAGNYFKVCVLSDDSDYGKALAAQVTTGLGGSADSECSSSFPTAQTDFKTLAGQIAAESPDAVYFAGFYPQAAPLLQQLRDSGVTASFVSSDGTNVQAFVDQIDTTANGTTLSCGCAPAPDAFADAYRSAVGHDPGAYSTESYDLATILLKGIDGGKVDRPSMTEFVRSYNGAGLARTYQWDAEGELSTPPIWIYKVQ